MCPVDHDQVRALSRPGEHSVDVPVYCSLTRFGLRSGRHLPATYRDYRAVVREASETDVPGLLRNAFLIENPRTCYSLSLWSSPPIFSAEVPRHIEAARRVFSRLALDPDLGPELWTTKWRLVAVTNNLRWDGFDLRQVIAGGRQA